VTPAPVQAFMDAVQHNCHVADARHAAEMTLCTYLLQMREFFRWEQGLALGATLAREAVGGWMAEREALWARLDGEDYRMLPLPGTANTPGRAADPFDVEAINAALAPWALLYGAGRLDRGRPVFFVADLHRRGEREGLAVLQAGHERARTLLAPPAALGAGRQGPIVLRRESMARWCWERAEGHSMRPRPGSALQAMLAHYGLDRDFAAALPRWVDDQCETAVWHEIGEHRLTRRWGARWAALRAALARGGAAGGGRAGDGRAAGDEAVDDEAVDDEAGADASRRAHAEALVRLLRDQLADLGVTLPMLLARGEPGPLHAWFAGYDGLREASHPALTDGYRAWRGGDGGALLRAQCAHGLRHFEQRAAALLEGPAARRAAARRDLLDGGVPEPLVCRWPAVRVAG
jgi:hypothetical protein